MRYSLALAFAATWMMLFITLLEVRSPFIITTVMTLISVSAVFPVQILFPASLRVIENSKGRISALTNCSKLLFTAIFLEIISYYYTGSFFLLGITIAMLMFIATMLMRYIVINRWVDLE